MKSKLFWLVAKTILIGLLTLVILVSPTQDSFRKWLRFGMLVLFVASFIIDLNNYKKNRS